MEFNLYREIKMEKGWQKSKETTVSVMEFDKGNKIKRLIDYL
jgi:hypothetical protein